MKIKTSFNTTPGRIAASATIERHSAPLDARSLVAIEFAQFWLKKHASIHVPPAVLLRRGLHLLADHLSRLEGHDVEAEARALKDTGKGSGSALSLTQARARIEEHLRAPAAQPMDRWQDALYSVEENRQSRDMLDSLEAVMAKQFPDEVPA